MNLDAIINSITEEVFSRIISAQNGTADHVEVPAISYPVPSNFAKCIEHCLLNPKATIEEVRKLCGEARENGFGSICIVPWYVSYAASLLNGTEVEICTMVGLPMGSSSTHAKGAEAREAVRNGAAIIDIVVNVEAVKSGSIQKVRNDIEETIAMTHYGSPKVRLVLEQAVYTREEKERICELAKLCKVNGIYISNSTGGGKACLDDVRLVRSLSGNGMEIKVSGGINSAAHARELLAAGANRIASSNSLKLLG